MEFIKIVEFFGGSQSDLARKLGVSPQFVQKMVNKKPVPPKRAIQIEKLSNGALTRAEIRPDIFGEA